MGAQWLPVACLLHRGRVCVGCRLCIPFRPLAAGPKEYKQGLSKAHMQRRSQENLAIGRMLWHNTRKNPLLLTSRRNSSSVGGEAGAGEESRPHSCFASSRTLPTRHPAAAARGHAGRWQNYPARTWWRGLVAWPIDKPEPKTLRRRGWRWSRRFPSSNGKNEDLWLALALVPPTPDARGHAHSPCLVSRASMSTFKIHP